MRLLVPWKFNRVPHRAGRLKSVLPQSGQAQGCRLMYLLLLLPLAVLYESGWPRPPRIYTCCAGKANGQTHRRTAVLIVLPNSGGFRHQRPAWPWGKLAAKKGKKTTRLAPKELALPIHLHLLWWFAHNIPNDAQQSHTPVVGTHSFHSVPLAVS